MADVKKPYDGEEKGKKPFKPARKKVCPFCNDKSEKIDYKDGAKLKRYVTEKGKILPRRQTGVCACHQRELTTAIKRARCMAILPFKGE
ncbi:MAG: 30S ribosomal protein S18 [Clostridiales bacterium]|nr:30S ribosomal protein S18 [Candidatus Apopatousia equi]